MRNSLALIVGRGGCPIFGGRIIYDNVLLRLYRNGLLNSPVPISSTRTDLMSQQSILRQHINKRSRQQRADAIKDTGHMRRLDELLMTTFEKSKSSVTACHIKESRHQADSVSPVSPVSIGVIFSKSELLSTTSCVFLFFKSCRTAILSQLIQIRPAKTPYTILPPVVLFAHRKPKPPWMMASVRITRPHHTCRVDQIDRRCCRT